MHFIFAGAFVASGSDDGRWFIWEKRSGRLVKMLAGDESGKSFNPFYSLGVFCVVCSVSSFLNFI